MVGQRYRLRLQENSVLLAVPPPTGLLPVVHIQCLLW
jgi:hypothetical protein